MEPETAIGLTRKDIAILADGQGNIPDDTAERLAVFIRGEPRVRDSLEQLARMAEDAGARYLEDGLATFESLDRLRREPWQAVTDVLDPRFDVPLQDLISMAGALAGRAEGEERTELRELERRLIRGFTEALASEKFVQHLIDRLSQIGEFVAEEALGHIVHRYRRARRNGAAVPAQEESAGESHAQAG